MNKNMSLAELANTNEIYIDTTAILSEGFQEIMIHNAKALKDEGNTIKIHRAVINAFAKIQEGGNVNESRLVEDRLNMLKALEEGGVIQYMGNPLEPRCAEQLYLELMVTHRNRKNISLISNSYELVHDALLMNQIGSFFGKEITAFRLSDEGELIQVTKQGVTKESSTPTNNPDNNPSQTEKLLKMFGLR